MPEARLTGVRISKFQRGGRVRLIELLAPRHCLPVGRYGRDLGPLLGDVPLRWWWWWAHVRSPTPCYLYSLCCCRCCCHLITSSELNDLGPSERKGLRTFPKNREGYLLGGVLAGFISARDQLAPLASSEAIIDPMRAHVNSLLGNAPYRAGQPA